MSDGWLNEFQARACPACVGDYRAQHITQACAHRALSAARARIAELERVIVAAQTYPMSADLRRVLDSAASPPEGAGEEGT
jgi:hypothetical protein